MFSLMAESCVHFLVCVCVCESVCECVYLLGILACLTKVQCFLLAPLALSCSCWLTFSLPVKFLSYTLCSRRSQISQPEPVVPCHGLEPGSLSHKLMTVKTEFISSYTGPDRLE